MRTRTRRPGTAALAAIALAALAGLWLAFHRASAPRAPSALAGAPAALVPVAASRGSGSAGPGRGAARPAQARPVSAAAAGEDGRPRPGPDFAMEVLRRYSVEELDLLARAERAVRGEPPDEVFAIAEAHRRGADAAALSALVDRLSGPPRLRTAARGWLRAIGAAPEPLAPAPPPREGAFRMGTLERRE